MFNFEDYSKRLFNKIIKIENNKLRLIGFCYDDYGDSYIVFKENGDKDYYDMIHRVEVLDDCEQYDDIFKKSDKFIYEDFRKFKEDPPESTIKSANQIPLKFTSNFKYEDYK